MALADILSPFPCVCLFPWPLGGRASLLEAALRRGEALVVIFRQEWQQGSS